MNAITITYAGAEQFLSALGYSQASMELVSQAPSKFIVRKADGDPAVAADFPFEGQVIIQMDRVFSGGAFSGGTVIFKGRRTDFNGHADPRNPSTEMVFEDAWYDLEHIMFQHFWKYAATPGSGTISAEYFSRIILFQDISAGPGAAWSILTADQQLSEIIAFAASAGTLIQVGTLDPAWNFPPYAAKALTCADAIRTVLQSVPDAVTYFDYTLTPPKLHIRQQPNLTAVTLPYAGTDAHARSHKSSQIKPRPDLQVPAVVLQYQQTDTFNGVARTSFSWDAYPLLSTGVALRALVAPIDLRGGNETTITGTLTSAAFDPSTIGFWQKKKPELNVGEIASLAVLPAGTPAFTITGDDGTNYTTLYLDVCPRELLPGCGVADWMTLGGGGGAVTAIPVTVEATVSYTQKNIQAGGQTAHKIEQHIVSCRMVLTNSPVGETIYSNISHYEQGESQPVGLAQNIYNSLATLQYEGEHSILEKKIFQIISVGMKLNLSGGAAAWATMNAMITNVRIDFFRGETEVRFGPPRHLSPGELKDLLNMWKWRQVIDSPNARNTGKDAGGTDAVLGKKNARENSTGSIPQASVATEFSPPDGSAHQKVIAHDANAHTVNMTTVDSSAAIVGTAPQMKLDNANNVITMLQQAVAGKQLIIDNINQRLTMQNSPTGNDKRIIHDATVPSTLMSTPTANRSITFDASIASITLSDDVARGNSSAIFSSNYTPPSGSAAAGIEMKYLTTGGVTPPGSIILSLYDALGLGIRLQWYNVCIDNGDGTFTTKRALFLASDPQVIP